MTCNDMVGVLAGDMLDSVYLVHYNFAKIANSDLLDLR